MSGPWSACHSASIKRGEPGEGGLPVRILADVEDQHAKQPFKFRGAMAMALVLGPVPAFAAEITVTTTDL